MIIIIVDFTAENTEQMSFDGEEDEVIDNQPYSVDFDDE